MILVLCGVFYAVLCVFSLVTGALYLLGGRELNPLELSDSFVERLDNEGRRTQFSRFMGGVTFVVGVVQGLTAYGILAGVGQPWRWLAIGFTAFSIFSVSAKLTKGKISAFALLKLVAYVAIFIALCVLNDPRWA